MAVKEALDKQLKRAQEDAQAALEAGKVNAAPTDDELDIKRYPGAKIVRRSRNGAIQVTY